MREKRRYGITAEEAAGAIKEIMQLLPQPGETEIELINRNESLSWFEKWKIIRTIRKKQMGGRK